MSDPQGVYAANRPGRTLNEIYGLGLGSTTGQYAWPYAACSGRLSSNGVYSPLPPVEAVRMCKVYCGRKRRLTGGSDPNSSFTDISRFPVTTTCEQQCEEIGSTYAKYLEDQETVERYERPTVFEAPEWYDQPWYIIPLVFFATASVLLASVYAPLPKVLDPSTAFVSPTC